MARFRAESQSGDEHHLITTSGSVVAKLQPTWGFRCGSLDVELSQRNNPPIGLDIFSLSQVRSSTDR
jgi:hypothetical protein